MRKCSNAKKELFGGLKKQLFQMPYSLGKQLNLSGKCFIPFFNIGQSNYLKNDDLCMSLF